MPNGLLGRCHGELRVTVRPTRVLFVEKMLLWLEVLDGAAELAVVLRGIKGRDRTRAAFSSEEIGPRGFDIEAEGRDCAHAGDDDTPFVH